MKKVLVGLISLIVLMTITGCNATKDISDNIFSSLKKEEIVDKNLEFVETVTKKTFSVFIKSETYYIYKDLNDNFVAILYSSCNGDYTCDTDYKVSIYNADLTDEKIAYIDEDELKGKDYYYIFDNQYAKNNKYNLTFNEEYQAFERKPFFRKNYYTFELIK